MQYNSKMEANRKDGWYRYYKKRKIRIKSGEFLVAVAVSWWFTLVWMNMIGGVQCFALYRDGLVTPAVHRRQRRRTNELVSSFVHTNSHKEQLAAAIQFNKEITCCGSASDVLQLFVKVGGARPSTSSVGGANFNGVNFSTMVHRIACKATDRRQTVTDPRLAILFCAIAEQLAQDLGQFSLTNSKKNLFFRGRELSNIAWSMAKLQFLVPPKETLPILRYGEPSDQDINVSDPDVQWTNQLQTLSKQLLVTSTLLRNQILQIAEQKKKHKVEETADAPSYYSYIPTLRKLAGCVLDAIAANVLSIRNSSKNNTIKESSNKQQQQQQQSVDCFNTQELANLLWAFGTTKRGDVTLAEDLVLRLMIRAQQQTAATRKGTTSNVYDDRQLPKAAAAAAAAETAIGGDASRMKAQEVSNSVWALARMGARGPNQIRFNQYAAALLDNEHVLHTFKTQELANTAWGAVTLLMKRTDIQQKLIDNNSYTNTNELPTSSSLVDSETTEVDAEQYSVYRILKKVVLVLCKSHALFRPQEVSITLWACATTRFGGYYSGVAQCEEEDSLLMKETLLRVARNAVTRLREFQPQELNNLAWSYARLLNPITATYSSGGGEIEDEADTSLKEAVTHLFRKIGDEILSRKDKFAPQDISTTLWSFATIGFSLELQQAMANNNQTYPYTIPKLEDIYKTAANRVRLAAQEFKAQELSNSVWALATAGIIPTNLDYFDTTFNDNINKNMFLNDDPVTLCFGAAADELIKRPSEFKEQEIKDILWSFSKVGMRHPKLFLSVAEHLVGPVVSVNSEMIVTGTARKDTAPRGLSTFSPQGFGNLAWSFAKQATISVESDDTGLRESNRNTNVNGRLAVYETSCLDLGEGLLTKLFASIAEACIHDKNRIKGFKPQDISNVIWSFATLGLYHTSLLSVCSEELVKRVTTCPVPSHRNASPSCAPDLAPVKPQEAANLMWSYATLNFRCPKLVDALAAYIVSSCRNPKSGIVNERSIATMFNRQELANIAWSCAVLEKYPPDLMSVCYMGLLGNKNRKPSYIRSVMGDMGLQRQAVRTLLYVQLALDMEASHLGLTLPDNFPSGFGEKGAEAEVSAGFKVHPDGIASLALNPSKTQLTISRALQRIGFDHVQEYVLEPPMDFLSIDIANPDKKLGVEVDGPSHYANVLDDVLGNNEGDTSGMFGYPFDLTTAPRSSVVQINNRKRMQFRWEWHGRRHENGPTALKHRMLCHLGWLIAHSPFWEWNCVAGNIEDENYYLRELIKEITDPDEGDDIEI